MFEGIFQPMHLLFILVIALVVFGPGKLPEVAAGLGKGIREFKKAMAEGGTDLNASLSDGEKKAATASRRASAEESRNEGSANSA